MSKSIPLTCKHCISPISASNIDATKAIAVCNRCNCVFNIDKNSQLGSFQKARVELPSNVQASKLKDTLIIKIKWRRSVVEHLLFTTVSIAWTIGAIVLLYSTLNHGQLLASVLFACIVLLPALLFSYIAFSDWLNYTLVEVKNNKLNIAYKPLPWPGNTVLDKANIEQLYVQEEVHKNKNGTTARLYHLMLSTHNDELFTLLDCLQSAEQALYLEQEIEAFLGIEDRRVEGGYEG